MSIRPFDFAVFASSVVAKSTSSPSEGSPFSRRSRSSSARHTTAAAACLASTHSCAPPCSSRWNIACPPPTTLEPTILPPTGSAVSGSTNTTRSPLHCACCVPSATMTSVGTPLRCSVSAESSIPWFFVPSPSAVFGLLFGFPHRSPCDMSSPLRSSSSSSTESSSSLCSGSSARKVLNFFTSVTKSFDLFTLRPFQSSAVALG